jgi:hypothetical protein
MPRLSQGEMGRWTQTKEAHGGARKIDKLLTDDIVERRLAPVARPDRFSRSALLNPDFMLFTSAELQLR